jgi:hypothetical protein
VNIHTFPGAGYELFSFTRVNGAWRAAVAPEYYGLLMFARATPPGSRLVPVSATPARLRVWATSSPDGRIRVVLINKAAAGTVAVRLRLPSARAGSVQRLVSTGGGARLGGRSFGSQTRTGILDAPNQTSVVKPSRGTYVVDVPAMSAALLTVPTR